MGRKPKTISRKTSLSYLFFPLQPVLQEPVTAEEVQYVTRYDLEWAGKSQAVERTVRWYNMILSTDSIDEVHKSNKKEFRPPHQFKACTFAF